MNNKKFNSKEELDNYLLSNKTPFSVIDQKIDYSLVSKKKRKVNVNLWKKITIGFASLCLVIVGILGVIDYYRVNNKDACPFELGTYTYASQEGSIEGLDFSESSYIVLTDEELTGPGTFVIEDEDNDWVVYGKFYECILVDKNIGKLIKNTNSYKVNIDEYKMEFYYSYHNNSYVEIYIKDSNNSVKVEFINLK